MQIVHITVVIREIKIVVDRDLLLKGQRCALEMHRCAVVLGQGFAAFQRRCGLRRELLLLCGQICVGEICRVVVPIGLRRRAVVQKINQKRMQLRVRALLQLVGRVGQNAVAHGLAA